MAVVFSSNCNSASRQRSSYGELNGCDFGTPVDHRRALRSVFSLVRHLQLRVLAHQFDQRLEIRRAGVDETPPILPGHCPRCFVLQPERANSTFQRWVWFALEDRLRFLQARNLIQQLLLGGELPSPLPPTMRWLNSCDFPRGTDRDCQRSCAKCLDSSTICPQ